MRAFSEGTQYITGCQTPFERFYLQVKHKYSVPPDRCQTPFQRFHLQVIHKYSLPLSERCQIPFEGFHQFISCTLIKCTSF